MGSSVYGPVVADGVVGFTASVGTPTRTTAGAIYVGGHGALRLVAMSGTPAPVPGADYGSIQVAPALDDAGHIAFSSGLDLPGGVIRPSAVLAGSPEAPRVVAMAGDVAPGARPAPSSPTWSTSRSRSGMGGTSRFAPAARRRQCRKRRVLLRDLRRQAQCSAPGRA